jgi:hypothetical protein
LRVTIDIHLKIDGISNALGGEFNVRWKEDIPGVAYEWIRKIKMDTGFRKTVIEKVVYNGDNDITDLVKAIDERPIPNDNLPF